MADGARRAWVLFHAGEVSRAVPEITKEGRKRMAEAARNRWKLYRAEKALRAIPPERIDAELPAIDAGEPTDEELDLRALATMPWRAIEEKRRVAVPDWKETAVGCLFRGPVRPRTQKEQRNG